jgi:uncharacterized protein YjiS (DUF1127 family)
MVHAIIAWVHRNIICFATHKITLCSVQQEGTGAVAGVGRTKEMNGITKFLRSWRRYNHSMRELSRLGDRELADIGVSRSDIPRLAWENSQR